jgi:hypothetical protein
MVEGDVQVAGGRRTGCLWKTYSLIMRDVSVHFLVTLCTFLPLYTSTYSCTTRVGGCGNVYPYTVSDDRVGRDKKRKDNGKEFWEKFFTVIFSFLIPSYPVQDLT